MNEQSVAPGVERQSTGDATQPRMNFGTEFSATALDQEHGVWQRDWHVGERPARYPGPLHRRIDASTFRARPDAAE